jgi:hypothetical protein
LDFGGHKIDTEPNALNFVPFSQHAAKNGRLHWQLLGVFIAVVASVSYFYPRQWIPTYPNHGGKFRC